MEIVINDQYLIGSSHEAFDSEFKVQKLLILTDFSNLQTYFGLWSLTPISMIFYRF